MLEDAAQEATTDEELGALKRKIDICFKQKRPRLVQAINRQVSDAIVNRTSLTVFFIAASITSPKSFIL